MGAGVGSLAHQRLVGAKNKPVHALGGISIALCDARGKHTGNLSGGKRCGNAAVCGSRDVRMFGVLNAHRQGQVCPAYEKPVYPPGTAAMSAAAATASGPSIWQMIMAWSPAVSACFMPRVP